ncbi:MAG: hypothetical protein AAGD38_06935 [Acidobacteriota bacterium]
MNRYWNGIAVFFVAAVIAVTPLVGQPTGEWIEVHAPSISVLTDAGVERGAEIAAQLEHFRAVFAQLAPELDLHAPVPLTIIAFRNNESFSPYKAGRAGRGTALLGQLVAHPDGHFLTTNADPGVVDALDVLFHEYTHHLVRTNLPEVPLWLNEGLAEYYSTFATDGESVRLGEPVERHIKWLKQYGVPDLDALLRARQGVLGGNHGPREVGAFYAGSWLLAYHLLADDERLARTADYLLAVVGGEDPVTAFEDAMGERLGRIEEELADRVAADQFPTASIPLERLPTVAVEIHAARPADVLTTLGELCALFGRIDQAERHHMRALELDPQHAEAHAGVARLAELAQDHQRARLLYGDAVALPGASARTYLRAGRHWLRTLELSGGGVTVSVRPSGRGQARTAQMQEIDRQADGARKLLRRGMSLDPGFAEIEAVFGLSHRFGDADPRDGLAPLGRAIDRLAQRLDLVVAKLYLFLRAGEIRAAENVLETSIVSRADDQLVLDLRDEIERWALLHAAQEAFDDGAYEDGLMYFDQAVSATRDPVLREAMEAQLRHLQDALGGR